ncbi:hypothetical protein DV735_g5825, partial [Chaetothyriales sp. CBS 134920]
MLVQCAPKASIFPRIALDKFMQVHAFCSNDRDQTQTDTAWKHTSTIALPQPPTTIPHSSSDGPADDAQALHDIFNSSSSTRGYQTPVKSPNSFDHGFHVGSRSQTSQKQQPSRIERLGEHIRQKLSETKLSKTSLKLDMRDGSVGLHSIHSVPAPQVNQPLGVSHSSPGLTELLTSRNASRGGYDSDAHTIKTPLLHSNTGTLKPDSARARDIDMLFQNEFHMGDEKGTLSRAPATPLKTSFTAAVESSLNESPSDALRRLSVGIASGTIKRPGTPELRVLHKTASCEKGDAAALAPHSVSSEQDVKTETMHKALKRLSDCVQSCVGQSSIDEQREEKQSSLVLELDPALVNYIRQFSSSDQLRQTERANRATNEEAELEGQHKGSISPSAEPFLGIPKSESQPGKQQDEDSIHLFNMRISQRLASFSQAPVVSPTLSTSESKGSSLAKDAVILPQRTVGCRPQGAKVGLVDGDQYPDFRRHQLEN